MLKRNNIDFLGYALMLLYPIQEEHTNVTLNQEKGREYTQIECVVSLCAKDLEFAIATFEIYG